MEVEIAIPATLATAPSGPLPADVLRLILRPLVAQLIIKQTVVSKLWRRLVLSAAPSLTLRPAKQSNFDNWTDHLSEEQPLSSLTQLTLSAATNPDILGRLLQFSPCLREFAFWLPSGPSPTIYHQHNPLCNQLRNHTSLREVTIDKLSPDNGGRIIPFLPSGLTKLRLFDTRGHLTEAFFTDIATTCPNLSHLSIRFGYLSLPGVPASILRPLKKLTSLVHLALPTVSGISLAAPAPTFSEILAVLDTFLPPSPHWELLYFGFVTIGSLFGQFVDDIPLLRALVRRGVLPRLETHLNRLVRREDEVQLAFIRFLLEECHLSPSPCHCKLDLLQSCTICSWFSIIPAMRPKTGAYIVERHFLPFVAAMSAKSGLSPDATASYLLRDFDSSYPCNETIVNYIQNLAYPLQIGPTVNDNDRWPLFFLLRSHHVREALVARALALNADLGLGEVIIFGETDPAIASLEHDHVMHAATLSPVFFVNNLGRLVSWRVLNAQIDQLARECPLAPAEILARVAPTTEWMLATALHEANVLWSALRAMLPEAAMAVLVTNLLLTRPLQPPALGWLLNRNTFDLGQLRSPQGENWLHFQLEALQMLDNPTIVSDPTLLAQKCSLAGDTPIHRLCQRSKDVWALRVVLNTFTDELWKALEEQGVWSSQNNAGRTPLELLSFDFTPRHTKDHPRLRELVNKYLAPNRE